MGKIKSKVSEWVSRLIKGLMVVILLPVVIGLLQGMREQLGLISTSAGSARQWIEWGLAAYVGIHVVLYRPVALFRASHALFSAMAVWLFGGQVASTEQPQKASPTGRTTKREPSEKGQRRPQGSVLVAFSPYVVPVYTVLLCLVGWGLRQWVERATLEVPLYVAIGMSLAFHWLMTADELQEQRRAWHMETYLLAVSLVFGVTLVVTAACLPLVAPELSFVQMLGTGLTQAQAIYTTFIQRLFL
ncbi:MAG TPA: hypothetical protein DDX89_05575 [Candidatus Omnitrophica bacterium]|nr:MAG: hypothetical protein A2Z92_05020 [Omnitrophica WOR_2 bacterium GWA2_63_20]OGX16174.1 MAG: hypothetical protein A2105_06065 [Omnitrophica WOR_2 bacterium GWF2_63_9]OGX32102.1 MAG: hypothetical protein A3E56_03440 [Omnitrophica WOR_2 bacterium RIFCSPHIGHO2_12_FULL_64_13]OGX35153.1 MAG: hypothetical protein A3B73_02260 [Omnitrophica WOR_2 bacterium RIFCSPHIGHO2_02_FULL_63_39]OGX45563.1 MAG: hypothetical protein A3I71_01755 [Omnitrophica WOR_2 bacterium RIFCSPLOWO2_02_FULL_63_16]OGX48445.1